MDCSTPGFPVLHHLPRLAQTHVTELVMPSNHLSLYCPLLLPSIFSIIRVFSNESALHKWWPKYWSFSFSISPSNEYSGLISFRIDWLDLLAVQGTLKSLYLWRIHFYVWQNQYNIVKFKKKKKESSPTPQFKSINFWHTAFFMVQLSHSYMTTGKIIALTRQNFVGQVMSLLF